ncbi:MAG: Thiamine-phosphate synthase [Methanomassiliicoccales archaeon PtaU1.Bin124]|nr:MAG: Thiamine-phosphate synthase [Methanomassiliicoccales archaeon PtaU1.Bin124]
MRYDLYIVTDSKLSHGMAHAEVAAKAVKGGADIIQLRDKNMSKRELYLTALEMRQIAKDGGASFIVNDCVEVALAAKADGVHLGQDDLPLEAARRISPPGFIIGISVGSAAQARKAEEGGADYVALSPVFDTATKADVGPGKGLEVLREIHEVVSIPIVAIGGIDKGNVRSVLAAGADGIAVISAVVGQKDVEGAAREMKTLIARSKGKKA